MTLEEQLRASEKRANELRAKVKKQEEEKYIIIGKADRKKIDKLIEQKKFW